MDKSGSKLTTGEYATRALIDVAAKVIAPVATLTAGYIVYFHGQDIANYIRKQTTKIKRRS